MFSSGHVQYPFILVAQAAWSARRDHSAVAVEAGTRIVVTGGTDYYGGTYYNDVWISGVGGATWTQLLAAAPYAQRYDFGFVNIAEKLFVFGGGGPAGTFNDSQTASHTAAAHATSIASQPELGELRCPHARARAPAAVPVLCLCHHQSTAAWTTAGRGARVQSTAPSLRASRLPTPSTARR